MGFFDKLKSGLGIVGCSGNPSYAIRFNRTLDNIGSYIKLPKQYSEFVVVNSSLLFFMYSEINDDPSFTIPEYDGCYYYLPVCNDFQKFSIKKSVGIFNFEDIKKSQDELKYMDKIYIKSKSTSNAKIFNKGSNDEIDIEQIQNIDEIYYKNNNDDNSFEEIIYYNTIIEKSNDPVINDFGGDEDAKSQDCILSIINCYKSCESCDDKGDDNNNNCNECYFVGGDINNQYYFIDDQSSKQCLKDNVNDKYYFDNVNKVLKRCYTSCKKCDRASDSQHHNCLECDESNNYFTFKTYGTLLDCYLDSQPPDGYYCDHLDHHKFKN